MSTQKAIFSYEEVIDLHTESNRVSVIGIHTPTGDTPRRLCPGFFEQFKKYKYLGCSVTLVPAATLPADPLSVSYEAGEPTIDPRDMLNPILFHGCHGNDMGNILNRLYSSGLADSTDFSQVLHSDSVDLADMWNIQSESDDVPSLQILESLYYRALTDKTWKKANVQRGFRKTGLRPRIYSLATNMQLMGQTTLGTQRAPGIIEGTLDLTNPLDPEFDLEDPVVNPVRYFTPRTVPLGWLDTRQVVPYVAEGEISNVDVNDLPETIEGLVKGKTVWNELPEIYMGMILLPPAYKTEMYFRMVVNHHFAFAGFRGISLSNDMIEMPPNYDNWNDALTTHQDPPEPEPVGGLYQLTDLHAAGAPNIGDTAYNTYDELWYAGNYHGVIDVSFVYPYQSYTLESAYFTVPQSVALNPSAGGDPIGYDITVNRGDNQLEEHLQYNDVHYRRIKTAGNWGNWNVYASGFDVGNISIDGDDLAITEVDLGGDTKYDVSVAP